MNLDVKKIINRYQDGDSMKQIACEVGVSPSKVRKILITAGELQSKLSREINKLYDAGYSVAQISEITGHSKKWINNNLPYSKGLYKEENATENAQRIRNHRVLKKTKKK